MQVLFNITASGGSHSFVSKLDVTGNFVWAKSWGAATGTSSGNGLALDAAGNVYTTGSFEMFVDFDPGPGNANLIASNSDIFISKLDNAGNYVWAKALSGSMNEIGTAINVDAIGNVYTTGYFNGTVDFDPSPSSFTIASTMSSIDAYVHKICQLPLVPGIISGNTTPCAGTPYTYSVTPDPLAASYSWTVPSAWSGTSTTNILAGTPGLSGSILLTANNACGTSSVQSLNVNPLQASVNTGSSLNLACRQQQFVNAISNPPAPTSVIWTPTVGLSNATVFTPTAIGTGTSMTYSVTVNLSNGCVVTSTLGVTALTQVPDICQVTVDSLGINNEIYWDKTLYPAADSFFVYRETSLNVYKKIAGLSRTAFSMYVDTNRTIGPANGNPNATYYKYKLQMRDSCGNYSALSKWHETIFIQDQSNGNFNWNSYAIESSTSPISIYNLKGRDLTVGTETIVTSTTGGLANDALYNTVWPNNIKWFVDAVGFSCNATAKVMVLKTKTKSNQSNDKNAIGIKEYGNSDIINMYPNPANDILNIDLNALSKTETEVEIRNMLGQIVYQTKSLNQHLVVNTTVIAGGVYMVNIKQNGSIIAVKKVVIER
ncbi:MAG: T9SS type A sorting domain-containing protein [Sphingobacteriaceae bacterium]|nr:T9SS type A sorting domain-containing protein [Sphingobacteriaceae bacterium]